MLKKREDPGEKDNRKEKDTPKESDNPEGKEFHKENMIFCNFLYVVKFGFLVNSPIANSSSSVFFIANSNTTSKIGIFWQNCSVQPPPSMK